MLYDLESFAVECSPKHFGDLLIGFLNSSDPLAEAIRKHLINDQAGMALVSSPLTDVADWLDGPTAEDMLGVSSRTLQQYRSSGILPYSKVGNKIYYRRSDLSELIERHYKKGGAYAGV